MASNNYVDLMIKKCLDNYDNSLYKKYSVISEKDFYPPKDDRMYHSNVRDIPDGDNFEEYVKWFFDTYGEDLFDE